MNRQNSNSAILGVEYNYAKYNILKLGHFSANSLFSANSVFHFFYHSPRKRVSETNQFKDTALNEREKLASLNSLSHALISLCPTLPGVNNLRWLNLKRFFYSFTTKRYTHRSLEMTSLAFLSPPLF